MAILCSRPACTQSGISGPSALLMGTTLIALTTIQNASALPIKHQPFIPTEGNRPVRNLDITNDIALDTINQDLSCLVNSFDPDFSNSLGDGLEFCDKGTRMSSSANPCPGGLLCCACEPGTFHPQESRSDVCCNHTKCEKYEKIGDGITDSVCMAPESKDIHDEVTDPSSTSAPDPGTRPGDGDPSLMCELLSPCLNNGTCVELKGQSLQCFCTDGWEGEFCQRDKNECLSGNICKNGGTCNNVNGSFDCYCTPNWKGRTCEVEGSPKLSLQHPLLVGILVAFILMLILFIPWVTNRAFKRCVRRSRTYTVTPTEDSSHALTHFQSPDGRCDGVDPTSHEES